MADPNAFTRRDPKTGALVPSVVYDLETGESKPCWPIDGREMVASGRYSWDPPTPAAPVVAEVESVPPPSPVDPAPEIPYHEPAARRGRGRKSE